MFGTEMRLGRVDHIVYIGKVRIGLINCFGSLPRLSYACAGRQVAPAINLSEIDVPQMKLRGGRHESR